MIWVEIGGRLLRLEDCCLDFVGDADAVIFAWEALWVAGFDFLGLGDMGLVRMSNEGSRTELEALEKISVYLFWTLLGEGVTSSSESWISSMSINEEDGGTCTSFAGF